MLGIFILKLKRARNIHFKIETFLFLAKVKRSNWENTFRFFREIVHTGADTGFM